MGDSQQEIFDDEIDVDPYEETPDFESSSTEDGKSDGYQDDGDLAPWKEGEDA